MIIIVIIRVIFCPFGSVYLKLKTRSVMTLQNQGGFVLKIMSSVRRFTFLNDITHVQSSSVHHTRYSNKLKISYLSKTEVGRKNTQSSTRDYLCDWQLSYFLSNILRVIFSVYDHGLYDQIVVHLLFFKFPLRCLPCSESTR